MTIDELARASDIPTRTIRFYNQEKLLPAPVDFSGRKALYSDKHLEMLSIIKTLKEKHFMPLSVIKGLLKQPEKLEELSNRIKFGGEIFGYLDFRPPSMRTGDFVEKTGLTKREILNLEKIKILHPQKTGRVKEYSANDVRVAKLAKQMLDSGFSMDELAHIPKTLSELVSIGIQLVHDKFDEMLCSQPEEVLQKIERIIKVNNELMIGTYQQLVREEVKKHLAEHMENSKEGGICC